MYKRLKKGDKFGSWEVIGDDDPKNVKILCRCICGKEKEMKMEINKIKEARLAAGLTQKSMSDLIKIPMRTIGDWETGHRRPSEWVAALVIEKLNRIKQENAAAK